MTAPRPFSRAAWVLLGAALAAASCDRQPARPPLPLQQGPVADRSAPSQASAQAPTSWFTASPQLQPGLHLAYSHAVALQVGGGALRAHFTAARDRCLNTPALHCILLHAAIDAAPAAEDGAPGAQTANLQLRLPHDQVAGYANALTDPLPGEPPGLVRVLRQSTDAEDLGQPIADATQRTAQLSEYLASLKALGGRLTISVSDLVKIAGETAQAQSQIEAAQAQQRDLNLQVDTERLDVSFSAPAPVVPVSDPVDQTVSDAAAIFRASAAQMLLFTIMALPWAPVALAGLLLLALLRRVIFGRRIRPI